MGFISLKHIKNVGTSQHLKINLEIIYEQVGQILPVFEFSPLPMEHTTYLLFAHHYTKRFDKLHYFLYASVKGSEGDTMQQDKFSELYVDEIEVTGRNIRLRFDDDDDDFQVLLESIKTEGILEPLLVNVVNNSFVLIAGERRLHAAVELKMKKVPCCLLYDEDKDSVDRKQFAENEIRANLTVLEKGLAIRRYIDNHKGATHKEVAELFFIHKTDLSKAIKVTKLPEKVWFYIEKHKLSDGNAVALLPLLGEVTEDKIVEIATVAQTLTTKAVREMVKDTLSTSKALSGKVDSASKGLTKRYGEKADIKCSGKGYVITIRVAEDELDDTLTLMGAAEVSEFAEEFSEVLDEDGYDESTLPDMDVSGIERYNEAAENTTTKNSQTPTIIEDYKEETQTETGAQVQTENKADENDTNDLSVDNGIEIDDYEEEDYSYIEDEDIEIADDLWENIKFTTAKGDPILDADAVAFLKDIKAGRLAQVCSPYKYGSAIRHTYFYNGENICIDEDEDYGFLRNFSTSIREAEEQAKANSKADNSAATERLLLGYNTTTTETVIEKPPTQDLYDFPHPISSFPCEDSYSYEEERKLIFKARNNTKEVDLSETAVRELIHSIHSGEAKLLRSYAKPDGTKGKIFNYKGMIEIAHDPSIYGWVTQL